MEYVKSTILVRRTASVELIESFQLGNDLKRRSLSESDLNTWFHGLVAPLISIKTPKKSQNLEDFTIIWLDKNADHIRFDKMRLRTLINYCQIFSDIKDCLAYIHTISLEKIFFIVSGSLGQEIVPIVQDLSQKSAVAADFTGDGSGRPLFESVIFEIDIDTRKTTKPFANAQLLSTMQNENEIIFSIGTVFRIESVELVTDTIWQIKLVISEKDDEHIKEVYSYLQNDLTMNIPSLQTLGDFLREMAEYEKAEHYYRLMINELPAQHEDIANICNGIGITYYERGLYDEAMKYFQDVLSMKPHNYEVFAATYSNIGLLRRGQCQYAAALECFQKAVEIMESNSVKSNIVLASLFLNIGNIYDRQGDYRIALEYFSKSLDIARSTLPKFHPFFITLHNNIGSVYDNLADYQLAWNNYDAALTISQKILPPHHSSLVPIYINIGVVCVALCSYTKAFEYYNKALQIELQSLSSNQHSVATIYNNIGLACQNSSSFVEALANFEKALEFAKDPKTLTSIFNNLGTVFMFLKNHEKAIENLQKAIELKLKYLDERHPSLATTYHNLAALYQTIQDYSSALEYSNKTLDIDRATLPPNHPNLATTYHNVGVIYYNMLDYNRALEYCEQALRIMDQSSFADNHPLTVLCHSTIKVIKEKLQKT